MGDLGDERLGVAADPAKIQAKEDRSKLARRRDVSDTVTVLSSRAGRRFIWKILERCGHNRLSFVPRDHDQSVFNEGMRNIGLQLLADIRAAEPEAEILMHKEAQEDTNG